MESLADRLAGWAADNLAARLPSEIGEYPRGKAVAIQASEAGNLIVWRKGEQFMPKVPANGIDATGAGHAFVAELAVAPAEGQSL